MIYMITLLILTIFGYSIETASSISITKSFSLTKRNLYLIISGIVLTILASLRYAIGFDYFSYQTIFLKTAHSSFIEIFKTYPREFLFYFLNKLVFMMGGNYRIFLLLVTGFMHIIILWFISKYSKAPWISIFLYICFQFFAHNMNLLRQSLAASFFLCAFPYLQKKRFLPYFCCILIGGLFHNSVFIMIPFFFLLHIKIKKTTFLFLIPLAFLYFFIDPIFQFITGMFSLPYAEYKNSIFWQSNSALYLILPAVYFLFVCFYAKPLLNQKEENIIYIHSAFYTFYINLFITKHFILERFSVYFFLLSLIILPEIISLNHTDKLSVSIKQLRKTVFIFSLGIAYFIFASVQGYHGVYPYHHLFEKASSYSISTNIRR